MQRSLGTFPVRHPGQGISHNFADVKLFTRQYTNDRRYFPRGFARKYVSSMTDPKHYLLNIAAVGEEEKSPLVPFVKGEAGAIRSAGQPVVKFSSLCNAHLGQPIK